MGAENPADLPAPSSEPGPVGDYFEKAPALTRLLDGTEDEIRKRLARVRLFNRVFLLERDWMTRITMLTLILGLFWGAVGGFDSFGFQTQVVGYATGAGLHLSNEEIYSSVTLHGVRELFGFAQQLEMALFGFLLINALGIAPRHKWALYTSVGLINAAMLLLEGPVYLLPFNDNFFAAGGWYFASPLGIFGHSSYVLSPLWFLGWLALSAAVLLWGGWMVSHFVAWRRTQPAAQATRLPVSVWFILGTLILVPITYVPLVVSTVWDMGSAYAGWPISPLADQIIFWLFGHAIVYVLFLIPVTALYFLLPILARRPIYSYRFAVLSAALFVILTPLIGIHHLYLTPVPAFSVWLTMALSFAVILPSAITVFSVWMTVKGVPAGQWEWNAVSLFALLSFGGIIFGGLSGPVVATVPWDVDIHNSLFILSHFHAITILAIVAGAYAVLYAVFPILTGRLWYSPLLTRFHLVLTAVGGVLVVLMFDLLGNLGVLRREVILPNLPAITLDQTLLLAGIVIILVGQLFFVANGFLTVFWGRYFSAAGLSFDEAFRRAAQSTGFRPRYVPIADIPFVRRVPQARRERVEKVWVGSVVVLLILVLAVTTPATLSVANGNSTPGPYPVGTEFVTLTGQQYFWAATESGSIHGNFSNAIVVYAGQWVSVNLSASGATQSLLIPFRALAPVDVQVVPGSASYALFQAPSVPGVYGVPDGEYDGPWYGQDVSVLIILPTLNLSPSLSEFQSSNAEGDIYSPPVMPASTASLVGDGEGLFNRSVPGPTLTAAPGVVAFTWSVPLASIGINNYLVNVTSADPNAQQQYVIDHDYTLPYAFQLDQIVPLTGLHPILSNDLRINATVTESADLPTGAYLYGVLDPVAYTYDPSGQAGEGTGLDTGLVMGLWGVLWVAP
jgi:heme/copper-type cytochrome/quinol oxidase subunit 1/heme/copper-type cytochrome/quinol oxidase subunit 2